MELVKQEGIDSMICQETDLMHINILIINMQANASDLDE
jgi:hypothetical protein